MERDIEKIPGVKRKNSLIKQENNRKRK